MFTGIVEGKGKVLKIEPQGQMKSLTIEVPFDLTDTQVGDSININGVCLTIVEKRGRILRFDLSPETLRRTTLGNLKREDEVNFERALKLSDRLGGHIVTGHIDGIGTIIEKRQEGEALHIRIRIPQNVAPYMVDKGAIAVDGVSLTINECQEDSIRLTLVPYTYEKTTLASKRVGEEVNVEADVLAKYVERALDRRRGSPKGVDLSFLKEHGFLKEE